MNLFHRTPIKPRRTILEQLSRVGSTSCLALGALLLVSASAGCANHEEKATVAINEAVQSCRDASADQAFYGVERFDGGQDEILRVACLKDIANFEIENNLTASATTGPVVWNAQRSMETDAWSVKGVAWPDLERARRALNENDPTQEQLTYANTHLESAQKDVPESAWIRLTRLDTLLKLRTKTRKADTPNPTTIGDEAQKQFDETVAWAKTNDDLDTQVAAQYMVVEHLEKYMNRVEMILESDGSGDDWLIKSAEVAEKEGRTEEAEKYRQELEDTQTKRAEDQEIYGKRKVELHAALCAHVAELSPSGVTDAALAKRVSAKKSAIDCMARAGDATAEAATE